MSHSQLPVKLRDVCQAAALRRIRLDAALRGDRGQHDSEAVAPGASLNSAVPTVPFKAVIAD